MWANPLNPGDTIGIISPSHTVTPDDYAKIISGIEAKGFRVKTGSRLYRHTYGYAASETERADDLNEMVSDKDVKLVLFGGGYGSIELLPYIDYEAIRRNPKLFSSHSDGTSILNAIYTKTGLVTYYGLPPRLFEDIDAYAYEQFSSSGSPGCRSFRQQQHLVFPERRHLQRHLNRRLYLKFCPVSAQRLSGNRKRPEVYPVSGGSREI